LIDVILPVLDEAESLPWVLSRMPAGYRALVVDNGSTDGSPELAAGLGARIVCELRRGFGAACYTGLVNAETDVVCFMDCDGSLDPADLPLVCDPVSSGAADLCLGTRQPSPGAWPPHARLANRLLALEVNRRTGLRIRDMGPMRAARRAALVELDLRDRAFGWPLEMVLRASQERLEIREVGVPYHPRRGGRSKVTGTAVGTFRAIRDMSAHLR
jgi:glycosyltransferase involved in cell wall biosynthesis